MPKKSRFPQQLGWEDFLSFMRELIMWLASEAGNPDHQPTLQAGLVDKVNDYEAALTTYMMKKDLAPEQRKLKDSAVKELRVALTRIKDSLPVFFDDPDVLGQFGIAGSIETDEDELYIQASGCMGHWAMVSADPEFAPLVPDFDAAQAAFDDFVAKRETYTLTFQAMQGAQNDMEELRIPIQEQERTIFDWYRSRHPDANDPWWTDTPWGTSSQQGEEEALPPWPGPIESYELEYLAPVDMVKHTYTSCQDAETCRIEIRPEGIPDWDPVIEGLTMIPEDIIPYRSPSPGPGRWEYRITPINEGGEYGEGLIGRVEIPE